MNLEQKNKLSKVTSDMEKVINHSSNLSIGYNLLTQREISETTYLEKVINLFRKDLFNILCELDFENQEFLILDDVTLTLRDALNDIKEVYEYSVADVSGEIKHTTNRKGQLIGILEWALDYIVGNIEVEEME